MLSSNLLRLRLFSSRNQPPLRQFQDVNWVHSRFTELFNSDENKNTKPTVHEQVKFINQISKNW